MPHLGPGLPTWIDVVCRYLLDGLIAVGRSGHLAPEPDFEFSAGTTSPHTLAQRGIREIHRYLAAQATGLE